MHFFKRIGYRFDSIIFVCESWLLDRSLQDLLSSESNIVVFQSKYEIIATRQSDEIVNRVFGDGQHIYKQLPEHTRLQKNLKQQLLSGRVFSVCKGIWIDKR